MIFKKIKEIRFFYLNKIFWIFLEICIFAQKFYQIFETGFSAQSHKLHGRHASSISGYTPAEQKVSISKQQLISFITLAIYIYIEHYSSII